MLSLMDEADKKKLISYLPSRANNVSSAKFAKSFFGLESFVELGGEWSFRLSSKSEQPSDGGGFCSIPVSISTSTPTLCNCLASFWEYLFLLLT